MPITSFKSAKMSYALLAGLLVLLVLSSLQVLRLPSMLVKEDQEHLRAANPALLDVSIDSTTLCGAVSANTTLTLANSPYIVTCDVTVNSVATLSIDQGVTLMFAPNTRMIVNGKLLAAGTEADQIQFTSNQGNPAAGAWKGIYFASGSSGNVLDNVRIQYAGANYNLSHSDPALTANPNGSNYTWSSVYVDGASVAITASTVITGKGVGINVYSGSVSIAGSTLSGITSGTETIGSYTYGYAGHGLYTWSSGVSTVGNTFSGNARRGLFLNYGNTRPVLSGNTFSNNGDYAAYIFQNYPAGTSTDNTAGNNAYNGLGIVSTVGATSTWPLLGMPAIVDNLTVSAGSTLTVPAGQVFKINPGTSSGQARIYVQGTLAVQGNPTDPVVFTSLKDDTLGGDTNHDGNASAPAAGDWQGMYFSPTSSGNTLSNAIIRYGGQASRSTTSHNDPSLTANPNSASYTWSSVYVDGASVAITASTVITGKGVGINVYSGSVYIIDSTLSGITSGTETIGSNTYGYAGHGLYTWASGVSATESTFSGNARRGLFLNYGNTKPVVANSTFANNGDYAAYIYQNSLAAGSTGNSASGNGYNGLGIVSALGLSANWPLVGMPVILDSLTVSAGSTLTVPAGQVFKVMPGTSSGQARIFVQGTLAVQGTSSNPVVFTSIHDDSYGGDSNNNGSGTNPAAGDWQGMYFAPTSTGNTLDNVIIKYAGQASRSTTSHNDPSLTANPNNASYTWSSIYVDGASVAITASTVITGKGVGINVYSGSVSIADSAISSIASGSETIGSYTYGYAGHGLYTWASGVSVVGSTLSNNARRGLFLNYGNTRPLLSGNTFSNNGDYAAYIFQNYPTNNSTSNNSTENGINGLGVVSTVGITATWPLLGMPAIIDNLTVNQTTTLTIPAGQVFKINPGITSGQARIYVQGTLAVQGNPTDPVVFTSLKDDTLGGDTNHDGNASAPAAGDWQGMYFSSTSSGNTLSNAIIRYGGQASRSTTSHNDPSLTSNTNNASYTWSSIYADGASVAITASTIITGKGVGINVYSGSVSIADSAISSIASGSETIGSYTYGYAGHGLYTWASGVSATESTFSGNARRGLFLNYGNTRPVLSGNTFSNNGDYAAYIFQNYPAGTSTDNIAGNNAYNGLGIVSTVGATTNWPLLGMPAIVDNLTVNQTTTLTIPAGQVFKINPGITSGQARIFVQGTLAVQGTSSNPVVFTSIHDDSYGGDSNNNGSGTNPAAGDWQGMYFAPTSTGNTLDNVIIKYAGQASRSTTSHNDPSLTANPNNASYTWSSIYVDGAGVAVTNSIISDGKGVGVNAYGGGLTFSGSVSSNTRMGTETIGSYTYGYAGHGLYTWASGVSASGSTFSGNARRGLFLNYGNTRPLLSGNTFSNNGDYAAYIFQNYPAGTSAGNSASGNGYNGLGVVSTVGATSTWPLLGMPAIVDNLTVSAGATLIVPAGQVFKINPGTSSGQARIYIQGTLAVQGTSSNLVAFTSLKDDTLGGDTNHDGNASAPAAGDWQGMYFSPTSSGNTLSNAIIRYGGQASRSTTSHNDPSLTSNPSSASYTWSSVYIDGGGVTITNSIISDGRGVGVNVYGIAANISNSAIYNLQSGSETIGSYTYGYSNFGAYSSGPQTIAENNWWGSDSGPSPYGSGSKINYQSCYDNVRKVYYVCSFKVDAEPWLGQSDFHGLQLGSSGPAASYQARMSDPVNTANGNYAYSHTDIGIEAPGLDLNFARSYNGLSPVPGSLGWGWTHTWNMRLEEDPASLAVLVTFGDGHAEKWTKAGPTYAGNPGVTGVISKNGDNTFNLLAKDQTLYRFSPTGALLWAEDKNGNRTGLAYDAQGRLAGVTDADGRSLTLQYNSPVSTTLISQVLDPAGRTVQFSYNSSGDLTATSGTTGDSVAMSYDANHRLLSITDAANHTFVRNVYDSSGRVIEQYDALNNKTTFFYDDLAHKRVITDPRSNATIHQYDGQWRLASETDAMTKTVSYSYDASDNRVRVVDKKGNVSTVLYDSRANPLVVTDTLGFTHTFAYDSRNNVLSETDARGNTTSYQYDAHGNRTAQTDSAGNTTTYSYNSAGQMTNSQDPLEHVTSIAYDAYGYRQQLTDALGNHWLFVYDSVGRKLLETNPLNGTTGYTYDAANRVTVITDALGLVTSYQYDAAGNRTSVQDAAGNSTFYGYDAKDNMVAITSTLGSVTRYTYDANNNRVSVRDPLNRVTTITYDALNRKISSSDPLNHSISYQYDANNNQTRVTDANNRTTVYGYDAGNRLISETDAAGNTVTYAYDPNGNKTSITDARGHATSYTYDSLNRLVSAGDPIGSVTGYTYDAAGNLVTELKPGGEQISYTYDALNRRTGSSAPGLSVSYGFDAAGNRTTVTDSTGATLFAYDALGRAVHITAPDGQIISYSYDTAGNRSSLTYPDGKVVTYTYDQQNRMVGVTDWDNHEVTYVYDLASQLQSQANPNGSTVQYAYDQAGRTLAITGTSVLSGTFANFAYTYDNAGNRLSEVSPAGTTSYSYDGTYQLTGANYPGGEQVSYLYDQVGNRLAMTSTVAGPISYAYDAGDRLLSAGVDTLAWDANGRIATRTSGSTTAAYTFDALDRLTQIVRGTDTISYTYNGDGVRVGKSVNGVSTSYLQDLAAPLPGVLVEQTGSRKFLYVYGLSLVARVELNGDHTYYHADALGSVRALSDGSGRVNASYSYDAFGEVRAQAGGGDNSLNFAGEQQDAESGMVYLRARYYDPRLGRFLSQDPLTKLSVPFAQTNRYVYASNNPATFTDPSGKHPLLVAAAVILLGITIAELANDIHQEIVHYNAAFDANLKLADEYDATTTVSPTSPEYWKHIENIQSRTGNFNNEAAGLLKSSVDLARAVPGTSLKPRLPKIPVDDTGAFFTGLNFLLDKTLLRIDTGEVRGAATSSNATSDFGARPSAGK